MSISRRRFLSITCRSIASIGAFGAFSRFGVLNAFAQAPDYKALVCVFLFGGNDGNNTVINAGDYTNYANLRGGSNGVALPASSLLPIQLAANPSAQFALHPRLTEIQSLFNNNKKVAIVANVGNLVVPTTRTQYQSRTVPLPASLFSHSDQQNQMQTAGTDSKLPSGWAGRVADAVQAMNMGAQYPAVVSLAGAPIFCNGDHTSPASVSAGNLSGVTCSEGTSICSARAQAAQQLLTFDTGISLVQAASQVANNANKYSALLSAAVSNLPALTTQFPPNNGLGAQLKQVAQIIQARNALGLHRQIFFVSLGGFDTHGGQLTTQDALLAQLSPALNAFYLATVEMNVDSQVTTFTESDFARTFQSNTNGGTDHAWGNHYFVIGGAVKGGDMYGTFPTIALAGPDDTGSNGRWIPTTSLDQYGATLATWFGVSATDMPTVFPTLKNFSTQNIGFI
jgi:uncharacterized protein (DUF1501 family)